MSLKTHSLVSSSLKASYLAVTLVLVLPATTYAAVLGDIHVISSYGQPFKAEIPLNNVSKREDGKLVPSLGKPEDYQRSNADFNAAYASLKFNVIKRGDQQFVEISSAAPLNVSLYDLVVELRGGIQRQVKQYSFMMDSAQPDPSKKEADADTKTEVATPVVAPPPGPISSPVSTPVDTNANNANQDQQLAQQVVKAPAANQSKDQPISSAPQPIPVEPKAPPAKPLPGLAPQKDAAAPKKGGVSPKQGGVKTHGKETTKKSFVVSKGDILGTISKQMKPHSVSLNQMMVALLRANPDAFVDNNINRLRSGTVLRVPSAAEVSSIDAKEANRIVIAQINDFDRYRQALANHVANTKGDKTKNSQRASGKVALHVNEEKNKDQPQDRLTLSKAGKSGGKKEEHIASKKALEDADSRVKALEKNVADLQKLLALKNQSLAEAQAKADGKDTPTAENDKNSKLDKQGFFAGMGDSIKHGWKRFTNFIGSLNDIPYFMQIAIGLLVALIALLVGLIFNRVRKNKKPVPEEVKDDTAYTAVAAGATGAAVASAMSDDGTVTGRADTPPVDIAQKIDFDLNLDNAQSTADAVQADNEPTLAAETTNPVAEQAVPENTETPVQEAATAAPVTPVADPAPATPVTEEPIQPAPVTQAEPETTPAAAPVATDAPVQTEAAAQPAQPTPAAPANNAAPEEEKLELDIPEQVDENGMPTPEQAQRDQLTMKLDLASAYQEIGDTEGAKELLEEIINSNNPDFAAQAKQKLAALQKA